MASCFIEQKQCFVHKKWQFESGKSGWTCTSTHLPGKMVKTTLCSTIAVVRGWGAYQRGFHNGKGKVVLLKQISLWQAALLVVRLCVSFNQISGEVCLWVQTVLKTKHTSVIYTSFLWFLHRFYICSKELKACIFRYYFNLVVE